VKADSDLTPVAKRDGDPGCRFLKLQPHPYIAWAFKITDKNKQRARLYANRIERIVRTGVCHSHTKLNEPDSSYIGYIGEFTFEELLIDRHKRFKYKPRCDGYADKQDFEVFTKVLALVRVHKLDIKTLNREHARHLMVPESQLQKYSRDFHVGAHILGDYEWLRFAGWATRAEVETQVPLMLLTMTRRRPYALLRSMQSLLDLLQ